MRLTLPDVSIDVSASISSTGNATIASTVHDADGNLAIVEDNQFPIAEVVGGIVGFLALVLLLALLAWWVSRTRAHTIEAASSASMQDAASIKEDVSMADDSGMISPRDDHENYGPISIVAPSNYDQPPTLGNEYEAPSSAL
jgi:hypothetical protein